MGKSAAAKAIAKKILAAIDTPEAAIALNGAEREKYLKALDEVYGGKSKRMADMDYGSKPWFHGTEEKNIQELKAGSVTGKRGKSPQVFLTDEPKTAELYGKPIELRVANNEGRNIVDASPYGQDIDVSDMYRDYNEGHGIQVDSIPTYDNEGIEIVGKEKWLMLPDGKGVRAKNAAFDPRFAKSGLLMAGGAAMPAISEQINPLNHISEGFDKYEKAKEVITKPLAKQLNFSNNTELTDEFNTALKFGLDPINLIDGPLATGLIAAQMLTPEKKAIQLKRKANVNE